MWQARNRAKLMMTRVKRLHGCPESPPNAFNRSSGRSVSADQKEAQTTVVEGFAGTTIAGTDSDTLAKRD